MLIFEPTYLLKTYPSLGYIYKTITLSQKKKGTKSS